jgi:hypothetical protein
MVFYMSFEQDVSGRIFQKNIDQVPHIDEDSKNKIKEVFSKNLNQIIENLSQNYWYQVGPIPLLLLIKERNCPILSIDLKNKQIR